MLRRYDLRRSDNYPLTNRVTAAASGTGILNVFTGFPVTSAIVTFSTVTSSRNANFLSSIQTGVMTIDETTNRGALWDYVLFNSSTNSAMAGGLRAVTNGALVEFLDMQTTSIGVVDVALEAVLVGDYLKLRSNTLSSGWQFSFTRSYFSEGMEGTSSSSSSSSSYDSSSSSSINSSSSSSMSTSSSSSIDSSSSSSYDHPTPTPSPFMKLYVSGYSETGFTVTYENIPIEMGFIDFVYFAV